MKKCIADAFKRPWYPFTIAVYPPLALLAFNISEVNYTSGFRSVVITLMAVTVLLLILRPIYRDWHAAAFGSATLTALFFTYGHVYDWLAEKWDIPHVTAILLGLWLLLLGLGLFWAWRGRTRVRNAALTLTSSPLAWFCTPPVQLSHGRFQCHPHLAPLTITTRFRC